MRLMRYGIIMTENTGHTLVCKVPAVQHRDKWPMPLLLLPLPKNPGSIVAYRGDSRIADLETGRKAGLRA